MLVNSRPALSRPTTPSTRRDLYVQGCEYKCVTRSLCNYIDPKASFHHRMCLWNIDVNNRRKEHLFIPRQDSTETRGLWVNVQSLRERSECEQKGSNRSLTWLFLLALLNDFPDASLQNWIQILWWLELLHHTYVDHVSQVKCSWHLIKTVYLIDSVYSSTNLYLCKSLKTIYIL